MLQFEISGHLGTPRILHRQKKVFRNTRKNLIHEREKDIYPIFSLFLWLSQMEFFYEHIRSTQDYLRFSEIFAKVLFSMISCLLIDLQGDPVIQTGSLKLALFWTINVIPNLDSSKKEHWLLLKHEICIQIPGFSCIPWVALKKCINPTGNMHSHAGKPSHDHDSQVEACVLKHFGRETSVVTESASRENIH